MPKTQFNQFKLGLRHLIHLRPHSVRRRSFDNYIKRLRFASRTGFASLAALMVISLLIVFPVYYKTNLAEAAGSLSDTVLSISSDNLTAGVDLLVTSDSGTFASTASGSEMSFNVSTNNVTGYQLSIAAKSGTALTNSTAGTSFASLDVTSVASGIDADTFGNASNTVYNNTWGFKPNYYKSAANSDKFYPSPTTSGVTLNKTESANTNADTYTIAIGARATYTQVAGTYTNTYILSAVGNYPQYKITYVDNTGDSTLNNMPSPNPQTTPSATGTTIKLSTTKPTRTGYTFAGWCTVDNSANTSACSGTTHAAEAEFPLSTLSANNVNLYTVWTADKYTCTKQYRLQGTDASYPTSYTTDTTEQVAYGATCSYSKSVTGYTTQSTSGVMNSTSGITLQVSLPRATYNVKVNFTTNTGVSSATFAASGWTTRTVSTSGNTASLAYGVQYTITPSFSNTSYELDTITLNSSSYGTLTNTSGTYYFTPNTSSGSAEITVTGKSSAVSLYDTIAAMTKGTQTAADLQTAIVAPTSSAPISSNSGVYTYNSSVFGTSSDASNNYTIYYYRGILDTYSGLGSYGSDGQADAYPNYVKLANNTCWRIVRTTGSGGVKMIYNGTWGSNTCAKSQTAAQLTTNAFDTTANSSGKSIVGVGYTYNASYKSTTAATAYSTLFGTDSSYSGNSTNSSIKTYIENTWYKTNMGDTYTSLLESNAGYCNDRTLYNTSGSQITGTTTISTPYTSGLSATQYNFGARIRVGYQSTVKTPSLTCPRSTVDLYTTSSASAGNKQLTYPAALLTADEVSLAGSGYSGILAYHANSYLRSGSDFWLLSPNYRYSNGHASAFRLYSDGYLDYYYVYGTHGVRPAISLTPGTTIKSGSGTATDPWIVQ